jgi:hypothetical protein
MLAGKTTRILNLTLDNDKWSASRCGFTHGKGTRYVFDMTVRAPKAV